ncbi:MAG: hypothetical protein ACFCUR_16615 [Rhodomicrobiaceae bacterium]
MDRLRRELATSKEAAWLEANLEADRQAFSAVPETASVADPQSTALKQLTGADEDGVRSAIAMLIAFLVEFGSALGFALIILAFRRSTPEQLGTSAADQYPPKSCEGPRPRDRMPSKLQIAKTPDDLVARWALDRLDIVGSGSIQADDAFQDFRKWCLTHDLRSLTPQMFGRRFTKVHAAMGGQKIRRRGRAYYVGATLHNVGATPKNQNRAGQKIERAGA